MGHLRIALGYRTEHRSGDAAVLGIGSDKTSLQALVDNAPAEFVRFEFGIFQSTGKAVRSETKGRAPVAAPAKAPEPRAVSVSTLEEVIGAGYAPGAAVIIVADCKAKAAAAEANPRITDDELGKVRAEKYDFDVLTVAQLRESLERMQVDAKEARVKADFVALLELAYEKAKAPQNPPPAGNDENDEPGFGAPH